MSRESDDNLSSINSAYTDLYQETVKRFTRSSLSPTSDWERYSAGRGSFKSRTPTLSENGRRTSYDYYLEATGRRRSSDHNSAVLTANTEQFIIGQRVWVGGIRSGQIAYIGETHFAPGDWAGIVLDEPNGKNDGCVSGKRYFQCEPKRGIFSRLTRLTTYPLSGAATPTSPLAKHSPERSRTVSPTASVRSSMLRSPGTGKNGLTVGDRVIVSSGFGSRPGVLRYLGETQFAPGNWCGIELDEGSGKNDGAVDGIRYFECKPKFGVFVPIAKVSLSPSTKKTRLSRTGSRESLTSIGTMNSIATTNTSRMRMNAQQRKSSTPIRPIVTTPKSQFSMQDLLREKQQHVEQLMVERDLDREDAQNQALQLQKNINELKTRIVQLEAELGDERKKSEELQFSIDEAQFCGDELNAQSQVYKEKIFDLEKKITHLVSATPSIQSVQPVEDSAALASAQSEITQLQDKLGTQDKISEARLAESLEEEQRLRENIDYLQKQNTMLQTELVAKDESLEKFSLSQCGIENLRHELALLKEENEKQAQQVKATFEQQLKAKTEELNRVSNELQNLKSNSDTLESERANVTDECEILQTEIRMRDEQIKDLSQQLDELTTQLNVQKADSSALDEMLKTQKIQNVDSKTQLETLQAELTLLKQTHDKMDKEKRELEQKLYNLQQSTVEQEKASGDSRTLLEQHQAEIVQLRESKMSLEQQLEGKQKDLDALQQTSQQQLEGKQKDFDALQQTSQEQLLASQAEINEKASGLSDLNQKLEQLQQQLKENAKVHEEFKASQVLLQQDQANKHANQAEQLAAARAQTEQMEALVNATQLQLKQLQQQATMSGEAGAQQLAKLQATLKTSQAELEITTILVQTTKDSLRQQVVEHEAFQKQAAQVEAHLKLSTENCSRLELELGDSRRQHEALQAKHEDSQKQHKNLEAELATSRATIAQLQASLKQLNEELLAKQQSSAALESENSAKRLELTSDKELLQQTNGRLERELKELQESLDKQRAEAEQKQKQLSEQEKLAIQHELALGDANRQREQLEASCQALTQQNETLQQQLANLHSSSTDSNAELLKLSQQLVEQQQSNQQLATKSSEERAALERQLQASQQRLDALCAQVELLTHELASSTEQSTQLTGKLKAEQELAAKQALELSDAGRKLEATLAKCGQLEQQQEKQQQEVNSLRSDSSDVNTKLGHLTQQLATAQKDLSTQKDASSAERLQLERELQEARQQLQASQAAMQETQLSEATARDRLKAESERREAMLDEQVQQLQAQLVSVQKEERERCSGIELALRELQERLAITNTDLEHKEQVAREDAQKITDLKTLVEAIQVANANISATNAELSVFLEVLQAEKSETVHLFELFEMESDMNTEKLIEKLQAIKRELRETHDHLDAEQGSKKELQEKLQQMQQNTSNMQGTAVEAAEQLRQLQQANGEQQDVIRQNQVKFDEMKQQLENKLQQLEAQLSINTKLQEQLQQVQQSERDLQAKINTSETALQQLQAAKAELGANLQEKEKLLEKRSEFDLQLAEYRQVIDEMDDTSKEKNSTLEKLRARVSELETALREALQSKDAVESECRQLSRQLQSLEMEEAREILEMRASDTNARNSIAYSRDGQLETEISVAKINFLNSIIADMQQKNDALKAKVQTLETLPMDFTRPNAFDMLTKRKPAPRLFCDICDEFDKHETEDCPLQAGDERDNTPPPASERNNADEKKERKLPMPRKYCETCEAFGHDTSECADDETY